MIKHWQSNFPRVENTDCQTTEACTIDRIVPGKLVYVHTQHEPVTTWVFKLDKVAFRKSDGTLCPYRGERMSELGLNTGSHGWLCYGERLDEPSRLIVDTSKAGYRESLGELTSKTIGYFWSR